MLLTERFTDVPIYFDGMAKKITEIYLSQSVANEDRLRKAFEKVMCVEHNGQRKQVLEKQCIVVTTSGMLDGGPVLFYLPQIAHDSMSSVLLTGYQAEETNGRRLLEEGFIMADNQRVDVKCFVKKYDLSAHAGCDQLFALAKHVGPKYVILNHGEPGPMMALKERIEKELGITVFAPEINEVISL
jgi:putative mRNA 3-end processing factor